jgi:hypothetical protein
MTSEQITELEAKLTGMSAREAVWFYNTLAVDDPRVDIVAAEIERRDFDARSAR